MKENLFFASAYNRSLLVLCAFLFSIATTVEVSTAAIVSPEVEGSSLKSNCQSSTSTAHDQATMSLRGLTPSNTAPSLWLAWLNHLYYVSIKWFDQNSQSGIGSQTPQIFHGNQLAPSTEGAEPSKLNQR